MSMDQDFTEEVKKIVGKEVTLPFTPGVVSLKIVRGDKLPSAVCTCGWKFGPNNRLYTLGMRAKNHIMDTGCKMRGKEDV